MRRLELIVSGLEMRELESRTIGEYELPGRVMMEVAGRAVAAAVHEVVGGLPGFVVVVCGTGNNGGDGFVAARALAHLGHTMSVYVVGSRAKIQDDARAALGALEKVGVEATVVEDAREVYTLASDAQKAHVIVDALFGTGLHEDVRGVAATVIGILNDAHRPVVSVDLPSGVNADTGEVMGRAVEATVTVTFGLAKRGHYLFPGAERRGDLRVVDIGVPERLATDVGIVGRVMRPSDGPRYLHPRQGGAHKGHFGAVHVAQGEPHMPGAAVLATLGALGSGVGLCRVAAHQPEVLAGFAPEVIRHVVPNEGADAWAKATMQGATAVVCGPGWGVGHLQRDRLSALLQNARVPLCLDADALNTLALHGELWEHVPAEVVLTPHPREMARLMSSDVETVQKDRFGAALQLAATRRCVTVLKGAGTVVAEPDGMVVVIAAGNPGLATGGTGDVLAGLIGGLLAQGLDPFMAACLGALAHGHAGDIVAEQHGRAGLRATHVADALGEVWRRWNR